MTRTSRLKTGFKDSGRYTGQECGRVWIGPFRHDGQEERNYPCSRPGTRADLPGMTIVCGDSHTSTHGAMGAVAFGIGTSEVEMVMASQCILQTRPKTMRITVDGKLGKRVTAKDVALYMMSKMTTSGANGIFRGICRRSCAWSDYGRRLTLCNLSIEMGAAAVWLLG